MYSDPSGLAPKKEKREAGLLIAPETSVEYIKAMQQAAENERRIGEYYIAMMEEMSNSFYSWLAIIHNVQGADGGGGGGGDSGSGGNVSGGNKAGGASSGGSALENSNETIEEKYGNYNWERGNTENSEKNNIAAPYSAEAWEAINTPRSYDIDLGGVNLEFNLGADVEVYGAKEDGVSSSIMLALDVAWEMVKSETYQTDYGAQYSIPNFPGVNGLGKLGKLGKVKAGKLTYELYKKLPKGAKDWLGKGNWVRIKINFNRDTKQQYFGMAFGAHPNYVHEVPKYLLPYNQLFRKINGHGHIKISDIK